MRIGRLRVEQRPALATFTALLAVAALLTPLWAAEPDRASGLLLLGGVGAELAHSFRREAVRRAAEARGASAGLTLLLALVLLSTVVAGGHRACDLRRSALRARRAQTRPLPRSVRRSRGKPFLRDVGGRSAIWRLSPASR